MARARQVGTYGVQIDCPGCESEHVISLDKWSWNGDVQKTTFTPSLLTKIVYGVNSEKVFICHCFVENGQIRYLDDTTHKYKGQTLELPEL